MNTKRATTAIITALAAGAVGVAVGSGALSTASATGTPVSEPSVETLDLAIPWQGGHTRFIDAEPKGLGPGDVFLLTGQPIFDNHTGKRIGSGDAVELIVSARHDGTVTNQSTLRLTGGHVDIDGIIRHTDDPLQMTVTGGTGNYLGVTGQLTMIKEDAHRKVTIMRLELIR